MRRTLLAAVAVAALLTAPAPAQAAPPQSAQAVLSAMRAPGSPGFSTPPPAG